MRVFFDNLSNWCVVIAFAIALVAVGFAHRLGPAAMTPELEAYVASGGALSDLCGPTDGKGQSSTVSCDACRIADTVISFHAACIGLKETPKFQVFSFVAKRIAERNELDPARLTRAPPHA